MDAFSVTWLGDNNWLVPPVHLVSHTILHLESCRASSTLLVPKCVLAHLFSNPWSSFFGQANSGVYQSHRHLHSCPVTTQYHFFHLQVHLFLSCNLTPPSSSCILPAIPFFPQFSFNVTFSTFPPWVMNVLLPRYC